MEINFYFSNDIYFCLALLLFFLPESSSKLTASRIQKPLSFLENDSSPMDNYLYSYVQIASKASYVTYATLRYFIETSYIVNPQQTAAHPINMQDSIFQENPDKWKLETQKNNWMK